MLRPIGAVIVSIVVAAVALAACEQPIQRPADIPQADWDRFTEPQKAAAKKNYDQGYHYVGTVPADGVAQ